MLNVYVTFLLWSGGIFNNICYQTAVCIAVFPGRIPSGEHVNAVSSKTDLGFYGINSPHLTLTWRPEMLSNNSYDLVDINLIGYKQEHGTVYVLRRNCSFSLLPSTVRHSYINGGRLNLHFIRFLSCRSIRVQLQSPYL